MPDTEKEELEKEESLADILKQIQEEEEKKTYYYRIDFVRLLEILKIILSGSGAKRKSFLDSCTNPDLFKKIIDGEYPITGKFINEIDLFFSKRGEDGVLIRTEDFEIEYVYLNKETLNFTIKDIDEERTKLFPIEYELLGNPERLRELYRSKFMKGKG